MAWPNDASLGWVPAGIKTERQVHYNHVAYLQLHNAAILLLHTLHCDI